MPNYYAQIDNSQFLVGVSALSNSVTATNLIAITEDDFHTLKKKFYKPKYNSGQWAEGATPEEIEAITNPPAPVDRVTQLEDENALIAFELAETQLRLDQVEQENADLIFTLVDKGVI